MSMNCSNFLALKHVKKMYEVNKRIVEANGEYKD